MRKIITTAALSLGALAATAGVGNASPVIDENDHVADVLTNSPILEEGILTDGINIDDVLKNVAIGIDVL